MVTVVCGLSGPKTVPVPGAPAAAVAPPLTLQTTFRSTSGTHACVQLIGSPADTTSPQIGGIGFVMSLCVNLNKPLARDTRKHLKVMGFSSETTELSMDSPFRLIYWFSLRSVVRILTCRGILIKTSPGCLDPLSLPGKSTQTAAETLPPCLL